MAAEADARRHPEGAGPDARYGSPAPRRLKLDVRVASWTGRPAVPGDLAGAQGRRSRRARYAGQARRCARLGTWGNPWFPHEPPPSLRLRAISVASRANEPPSAEKAGSRCRAKRGRVACARTFGAGARQTLLSMDLACRDGRDALCPWTGHAAIPPVRATRALIGLDGTWCSVSDTARGVRRDRRGRPSATRPAADVA